MRLLVAEDDARLLKSLLHIFTKNQYVADGACDGESALACARSGEYDGLVLDIMMPGMDGVEVLRTLRREGITTPALFLSARTEVSERVEGLDAGADDYLPKPFHTSELLARVRAMLRRKENFVPDLLCLGEVALNRSTWQLQYIERSLSLGGREFQILEMLMQRPGAVIATEQFMTHIWGWDTPVDTSVVWVHISNLRRKLEKLKAPAGIRFLRGAGYVLELTAEAYRTGGRAQP